MTPGFSPQEQYGMGATDARTDVYALGATLYALLTGQEPVESVQRTLNVEMPAPRHHNPKLSVSTEAVILKAMEMLPERRFQTAQEFRAALIVARLGEGLVQAERFRPPPQAAASPAVDADPAGRVGIAATPSSPSETANRAASAPPAPPTTGAFAARPPGERVAWPLIALHSAGLAVMGILQFVNETAYYIMDGLIEYSYYGFYTLTCLLLLVDGLIYRRSGAARRFELAVGGLGILIPAYNFIIERGDLATAAITLLSTIMSAAILWAALRGRDWRLGVLGAAVAVAALQSFFIAVDNYDALYAGLEAFAGLFALAGLSVLVNTLTRR